MSHSSGDADLMNWVRHNSMVSQSCRIWELPGYFLKIPTHSRAIKAECQGKEPHISIFTVIFSWVNWDLVFKCIYFEIKRKFYSKIYCNGRKQEFHPNSVHFPPKRHVCDPATFLSTWQFCSIMFYFSKETWGQRAPWWFLSLLWMPCSILDKDSAPGTVIHPEAWSQNAHGNHFSKIKIYIWKRNAGRTSECSCKEVWLLGNHITFERTLQR